MIVLAVKSYNGAATEPLQASFDALGGSIGRADSNLLVLPDPERTISRVHATVSHRDGVFVIEDRGSNPTVVNGRALGKGRALPLACGDLVQIGGYALEVRAGTADPPPPAPPPAAAASPIPADWDPMRTGSTPFPASAAPAAAAAAPTTAAVRSTLSPAASVLPDAALPAATGAPSIDDLFGLADAAPDMDAEPHRMLPEGAELPLLADTGAALSAPPGSPPSPAARDARRAPVVSWDGNPRQAMVVAASASPEWPPAAAATRTDVAPEPSLVGPATETPSAPVDALLQAFLEGMGSEGAPKLRALTPELMHLVGGLLAESVRGTIDLLHARAVVKNEMRADVTAIRPRQNNPLKFSPTAGVALQHLLTPTVPGFLPAQAAMRDAFQDLRAHELAVMAGVRSALTGLLQRFDPKTLEDHLSRKSGLESLLAGGRRAQLWQAYQTLFSQLSTEAEDDFHTLFGRAFLQAYEDRLDELKAVASPTGVQRAAATRGDG